MTAGVSDAPAQFALASRPRHARLCAIVPVLLALVVFWPVTRFDFVGWDDSLNITGNRGYNPPDLAKLGYFWRHPFAEMYIPVTYTVWGVLAVLSWSSPAPGSPPAINPYVFHTANLAVHVACVCAVYAILRRLRFPPVAACVGASLFAIHPLQVEPVAWVTGMKDVLGGLLSLLAVGAYLRSATARRRGMAIFWWSVGLFLFVLALLTKPAAVSVPLLVWAIDYILLRRALRQTLRAAIPWALLILPFYVLTTHLQTRRGLEWVTPIPYRPLVALDALSYYLSKLVVPTHLGPANNRTPSAIFASGAIYWTWVLPLAIAALLVRYGRRNLAYVAAGAVVLACILPTSGLIPFNYQVFSTVGDRYMFVAMLGVAIAAARLFQTSSERHFPASIFVASVALAGAATLAHRQTFIWKDNFSLFSQGVAVGGHPEMRKLLAGELILRQEFAEAERQCRLALEDWPKNAMIWNTLGAALLYQNRRDEAIEAFRRAVEYFPDYPDGRINLGNALAGSGKIEEARQQYLCVASDPRARQALEQLPSTRPVSDGPRN